jgi:hypothetical protein
MRILNIVSRFGMVIVFELCRAKRGISGAAAIKDRENCSLDVFSVYAERSEASPERQR